MQAPLHSKQSAPRRYSDLVLAFSVISLLFLLVVPLQGLVLDTLVATSIALALTTLLVSLYSQEVSRLSAFPSFLLFITLFRLGLNIATTRTILTEGQAGQVIQTFGELVTGGNPFVGLMIFLLLTGVNFLVITKGASRIAEVAARFSLDALPGKQLAIDADVQAGLIGEKEAKQRRDRVLAESDFYGAMDGASRFVRGDAMVGIAITTLNVIGSLLVGLFGRGMRFSEVVHVYITLVIGDGLVTQIPALFVSVGAGIIVTRSSAQEQLSESLRTQLFNHPRVLGITAGALGVLGLIPGMPFFVFAALAGGILLYWTWLPSAPAEAAPDSEAVVKSTDAEGADACLYLEYGTHLAAILSSPAGKTWLQQLEERRKRTSAQFGIALPSIVGRESLQLAVASYHLKWQERIFLEGECPPASLGCEEPAAASGVLDQIERALQRHLAEFLNRQKVSHLLDKIRAEASVVLDELIPAKLKVGQVTRILQNLLAERIPIRDLVSILETLADHSGLTLEELTEAVRQKLVPREVAHYLTAGRYLPVMTLDPPLEEFLLVSRHQTERGSACLLAPQMEKRVVQEVAHFYQLAREKQLQPVLLVSSPLRSCLRQLLVRSLPDLPVWSLEEVPAEVALYPVGVLTEERVQERASAAAPLLESAFRL